MKRRMMLLVGMLALVCMALTGCNKVTEEWAYIDDPEEPILRFYEDGTAKFHKNKYDAYEVTSDRIRLTKGDNTLELRYYDSEDRRYIYEKEIYEFQPGKLSEDNTDLIGVWLSPEEWSFQFTEKGTFLENGLWAGRYTVKEDGSVLLVYDNQTFQDTTFYYTIKDGRLTVEYPWVFQKIAE